MRKTCILTALMVSVLIPSYIYALGPNTVDSVAIIDGQVKTVDIDVLAVTTDKIADGNVTESKLAPNAITTGKLADLSVNSTKIVDFSITDAKLSAGAVTGGKIADGAVTDAKIMGPISPNKIGVVQAASILSRNTQALDSGEWPIVLNEEGFDYGGLAIVAPSGNMSIKFMESGLYSMYVWLDFGDIPMGNQVGYRMKLNGNTWDHFYQNGIGGGLPTQIYTSTFALFYAGDELTLYGYQNTGGPITLRSWAQFGVAKIGNIQ